MTTELEGKKLLLLGGIKQSCDVIDEARRLGVETFVTDYLEDSPAKRIADHAYLVDATDVDAVAELCTEQGIDGVFTGYVDMLLPFCERICRRINKPFWGNAENIDICINKEKFKEACEASGVTVVPWRKANKGNYAEVIKTIDPPVVIKPADNSGSRGVFKCYDAGSMKECAEKALSYSKRGEILIEEAMDPNKEFSVYYIMNHGEYHLVAMGDRYVHIIDDSIAPVGAGMLYPSVHLEEWREKMDPAVRKFFADNEMNDGFVFIQGFYKNGFYVHEIGYRLNGGFTYRIIEHFSKFSPLRELIRFSLTGDMDKAEIAKSNADFDGYGMIITVSLNSGKIKAVSGVEKIEAVDGVMKFYQLHEVGDELKSYGTTAQVLAYILCAVENEEQLKSIIKTVRNELRVYDQNGNTMQIQPIDPAILKFRRKK